MSIYLQQFLSQSGVASRRQATQYIKSGKLKVNGRLGQLGQKVDPSKDKIKFNNKLVKFHEATIYYLLNKPVGYVSTLKDSHASHKVVDLVPKVPKVWPVGRLDKDSHGLLILTNDGELTHKLTHPSFGHDKEYIATLDKSLDSSALSSLSKGVRLKEGIAKVDKIKKLTQNQISLTIHQGWQRQIRRMFEVLGYQVVDLQRVRIGQIKLGSLPPGQFKKLSKL